MNNEYSPDLITLLDEENQEHNFEILDKLEYNNHEYYVLSLVFENKEELLFDSGEYIILEVIYIGDEFELAEIEDYELKAKLSRLFEDRFNDNFYND